MEARPVADAVKASAHADAQALAARGVRPCLAVMLIGDDPASRVYVGNKKRTCEELGLRSLNFELPDSTTQQELLALVRELNAREDVHGILCQLPLPAHLDEREIIEAIDPRKDVDGFHPSNVGHIMIGDYSFAPCTPAGVMELLRFYRIDVAGKRCVVVGRSNIVGKPMAMLLLHAHGTVTICHSRTPDLAGICREADILVAAVGKPRMITADMVKSGAVVIDVGMNRGDGKLCGDVDYDAVFPYASHITPVPGGVGVMTVAMLMRGTVEAAKRLSGLA